MRQKWFIGVLAVLAVLIAGGLFASNMAFKLNHRLFKQGSVVGGGPSRSGTQTLVLPYFRQTNHDTALDLMNDIGGTSTVAQIARFVRSTDAFAGYTGTTGVAFPLTPGEAYLVQLKVTAPASIDYIMVGSHNHRQSITLFAAGSSIPAASDAGAMTPRASVCTAPPSKVGNPCTLNTDCDSSAGSGDGVCGLVGPGNLSRSGTNFAALPWGSANATALDIINEINAWAGSPGVVVQVARYIQSIDAFAGYTGTTGTAFTFQAGEGYMVQVNEDVVDWIPHVY